MPSYPEVVAGFTMSLEEAMTTQRAVRRLRTDAVDDETLLHVLRLATKAPTGGNLQGWEFVVVRDPEVKHALARLNRMAWSVARRAYRSRARGDVKAARMLEAVQWQADHFEDAPVIVVACLHGRPWPTRMGRTSYYGSVYPAVQNLLLAARSVGLGAALTTLPLWNTSLARRTLDLPRTVTPLAVVPLGWPMRGGYGPTTRRPVEEVLHLDHFGNRAYLRRGSPEGPEDPDADAARDPGA